MWPNSTNLGRNQFHDRFQRPHAGLRSGVFLVSAYVPIVHMRTSLIRAVLPQWRNARVLWRTASEMRAQGAVPQALATLRYTSYGACANSRDAGRVLPRSGQLLSRSLKFGRIRATCALVGATASSTNFRDRANSGPKRPEFGRTRGRVCSSLARDWPEPARVLIGAGQGFGRIQRELGRSEPQDGRSFGPSLLEASPSSAEVRPEIWLISPQHLSEQGRPRGER